MSKSRIVFAAALGTILFSGVTFAQSSSGRSTAASGSTAQAISYGGGGSSGSTSFTPSPTAPSFMLSSPCMGAVSASGTGPSFGISIGTSYTDKQCELRSNAATLYTMGFKIAAMQVMCQIDSVNKALTAAGQPCEGIKESAQTAQPVVQKVADKSTDEKFCANLNPKNPSDRPYWVTYCHKAS